MSLSLDSSPIGWMSTACGLKKSSPVGVPLVEFFISVPLWNKPAFLDASSDAILKIDSEGGKIHFFLDRSFCDLFLCGSDSKVEHTLKVLPSPGFLRKASSVFVLPFLFEVRKNP